MDPVLFLSITSMPIGTSVHYNQIMCQVSMTKVKQGHRFKSDIKLFSGA